MHRNYPQLVETFGGWDCRKTNVFPTICVLTSQNTDGEKFLCRNFSPSQGIKSQVHAPTFYDFAKQSLFYARCRAVWETHRLGKESIFLSQNRHLDEKFIWFRQLAEKTGGGRQLFAAFRGQSVRKVQKSPSERERSRAAFVTFPPSDFTQTWHFSFFPV